MTRTAYLHIGLPKTGTTYLQRVLWSNKQALADDGLLVAGRRHRDHLLASLDVRESPHLAKRAGSRATPWQDLVGEALAWHGDVLVSHEFFCAASADQVGRMVEALAGFEVRVVVTARSINRLALSRWQEWVKNGGKKPIEDFPRATTYDPADDWGWGSFDLGDVLSRWGSVLPHEHITVILVNGSDPPERLWHRFAAAIGADRTRVAIPDGPSNRSLGIVEIELLRRVNKKLRGFTSAKDRGTWIRGYLAQGGVLPQRTEAFRASPAKHQELRARDRQAVELLTTQGFRVDGDIGALLQEVPEAWRHPDDVTTDELLDSATTTIANLMRDVREARQQRDRLQRMVDATPVVATLARRRLGKR